MKTWVKERLVCPQCLPREVPLTLRAKRVENDDVLEGDLACPACSRAYPIEDGAAVLLPEGSMGTLENDTVYNSRAMLSAYLWSHFCDLLNDPDATDAYRVWSAFFTPSRGWALDIGCSVGRLAFEMSRTHEKVVGVDTSLSFIRKARELAQSGKLSFDLIMEGFITEKRACDLDGSWRHDRVEFIVADALALPFPAQAFSTATAINLLEKVPRPLRHLQEVNRVLGKAQAMFLFSDPFSWDAAVSDPAHWLGGVTENGVPRRGLETVSKLMKGKDGLFDPPMAMAAEGSVLWKIRKTENLMEHITSRYLVGKRN